MNVEDLGPKDPRMQSLSREEIQAARERGRKVMARLHRAVTQNGGMEISNINVERETCLGGAGRQTFRLRFEVMLESSTSERECFDRMSAVFERAAGIEPPPE